MQTVAQTQLDSPDTSDMTAAEEPAAEQRAEREAILPVSEHSFQRPAQRLRRMFAPWS